MAKLLFPILFTLFYFCQSDNAISDQIFLKNGNVLTGKILKVDADNIEYDPDGEIPWNKVKRDRVTKITYNNGESVEVEEESEEEEDEDEELDDFEDDTEGTEILKKTEIKSGSKKNELNVPENIPSSEGAVFQTLAFQKRGMAEFEWGWNSPVGLGARLDYRVTEKISVNTGLGLSVWGWRISGGSRYYFAYPFGFSLGAFLCHNFGISKVETSFETIEPGGSQESAKEETINFQAKPLTTLNLTLQYSSSFFSQKNKFYFEFGYAIPFSKDQYQLLNTTKVLSDKGKENLGFIYPGGIIISLGLGFGIF